MFHDNYQDLITQEQPITKELYHHEDIYIDLVTQYSQVKDVDVTLRISLRVRKPIISSDYVIHL